MKQFAYIFVLCTTLLLGCASNKNSKVYYYHPEKTSADREIDYTRCIHAIDARVETAQPRITRHLATCMESKGYEVLTEEEAKARGIDIPQVWPPYATRSSSTGPW